jgi:diguanylate cyclase (GGDEF)-like protein
VVAAAYSFARKLTGRPASQPLRQFIVDEIASATNARLASLAMHDETRGQLRVVATHGYPAVLVEHVRQSPGEGVLGRVFSSRRPMLVADVERVPDLHPRRPRYRTSSFLSVPLLSSGDVLGIVSVADRADDRPFDRNDLTAARALAAPAALALLNDRLSDQARALAHAATVDPLTNLFNRRYFQTRLEEEMQRARRHGLDLALLLIDVDDFKALNDQLGHLAGDHLLRRVADILKRSVRVFDVCTRFGGEEFAVLMPGSSVNNALVVAERIRSRIEGASPREAGAAPPHPHLTVSLGLAVLASDSTPHELVARADRALYLAKAAGKNCVRMD